MAGDHAHSREKKESHLEIKVLGPDAQVPSEEDNVREAWPKAAWWFIIKICNPMVFANSRIRTTA
jgi:hypothetical protein